MNARHHRTLRPGRAFAWLMLVIALAGTVFPFYWMVRTALTPAAELGGRLRSAVALAPHPHQL